MQSKTKDSIAGCAKRILETPKPNSPENDDIFERSIFFANKALRILEKESNKFFSDVESLIAEMGEIDHNYDELDRECLLGRGLIMP